MGYAAGSPTGTTGVGSSENATGQSQQAGFSGTSGGKGGGAASLPQPAQSSTANTATPAPAPVYGSNPAMRLNRPGGRMMDPSASMPTAPQTQAPGAAPTTPPPAAGGKGGGYGDIANDQGFKDFLEFYNTQQTSPNAEDNKPGSSVYEATDKFAAPTTSAETEKTAINNPYEMQMKTMQQDFDQRMKDLESKYGAPKEEAANPFEEKYNTLQAELDALKAAKAAPAEDVKKVAEPVDEITTIKDTGAEKYELGKPYEELTNATTLSAETQKAAEKAVADKAAAEKAAADKAAADKAAEDRKNNQITQGVKKAELQNRNIAPGQVVKSSGWYVYVDPNTGTQVKTKDLETAKKNTGATEVTVPVAKAKAAPKATNVRAVGTGGQSSSPSMASIAATTTKKAKGGIIHKGMSNKLKKMLGE